MDKLLLFHAEAFKPPVNLITPCLKCNRISNLWIYLHFEYYEKTTKRISTYGIYVCFDCYRDNVKDKSLDELKTFVPLLKVQKGYFKDEKDNVMVNDEKNFYKDYCSKDRNSLKNSRINENRIYQTVATENKVKEYIDA